MPPREWVERAYDVVRWTEMPRGGHFAAMEEPELLAADVAGVPRAAVGARRHPRFSRLKTLVKWLWSAKPASSAMSARRRAGIGQPARGVADARLGEALRNGSPDVIAEGARQVDRMQAHLPRELESARASADTRSAIQSRTAAIQEGRVRAAPRGSRPASISRTRPSDAGVKASTGAQPAIEAEGEPVASSVAHPGLERRISPPHSREPAHPGFVELDQEEPRAVRGDPVGVPRGLGMESQIQRGVARARARPRAST